ncbi:MAG: glycosyltransferase family 39 protein [Myxococcota bacterium]|nr:glycosyltransferase family 39 protein [Myxococcota bacterium]
METGSRKIGPVLVGWLLIAVATAGAAIPHIDALGLYYDEAFLAQQALDFLEPEGAGQHPPSVRTLTLWGRPFPVRNAVYLGSVKSQSLIPALAFGGASPATVRIMTLATGLLALGLAMLWTARLFGQATALWMGVLVATDPAFYFLSQFEWGPFTTNLLCRSGAALLITLAWQSSSPARGLIGAIAGGAMLGLGVFSRADFILIPAAAGMALALCRPDLVGQALRRRGKLLIAGLAAFLLAALPMIGSLEELLQSTGVTAERGGLLFRAQVLWQSLDGSHFLRLMETGGLFERTPGVDAPGGLLGWMIVPAAALLLLDSRRERRRHPHAASDPRPFLLLFAFLLAGMMLALPGAVRAHHQLNTLPLLHLIIASAAVTLWRSGAGSARSIARGVCATALVAVIAGNVLLIAKTSSFIETTGGRGRWSHALDEFAAEVDARQAPTVVSLDWGFHEPLLFLTRNVRLVESIWALPRQLASGRPWDFTATEDTTYLVHEFPYDLFGLGPKFLLAARLAGAQAAQIEVHRDAAGDPAFSSVRIPRPHRVRYDGNFRIRFPEAAAPVPAEKGRHPPGANQ